MSTETNGVTCSEKESKEEKMRELSKRLQDKETRKARELLVLAGRMSHFEAFQFVTNDIKKKINGTHRK